MQPAGNCFLNPGGGYKRTGPKPWNGCMFPNPDPNPNPNPGRRCVRVCGGGVQGDGPKR